MVALAFAMLGCNKEKFANVDKVPVQEGKKLNFTATIAAPTETKTTYTEDGTSIRVTWKVNDQIALVHNGVKDVATVTAVDGSGKATIEATDITGSPSDNDDVILVYPADAVASAVAQSPFPFTPDPACWDKVKGGQDGTLEYIQNNIDFRMGSGKLAVSGDAVTLKESVKVPSMICVWKLTLQDEASNPIAATSLIVRKGDDRQAVANCAEAKSTFYLCLVPSQLVYASGDYFAIDAVVGSDTYTFTKTGSLSLEESKYYQSTVKMTESAPVYTLLPAATTSDQGKVVCAAGHLHDAKTAVPTGCTAVGIIGNVTETGHGLILALHDATAQTWKTINGWTSTTTYASTTLMVLPDDAARGANLTRYTALGTTAVSNWAVAQKSDYEAIFTNLGSTKSDTFGTTYDDNVNAYITTGVGGAELSSGYFSATEHLEGLAAWAFTSDYWQSQMQTVSYRVRPVLGFGGDAAPAGPTAYTLAESTVGMIVGTDGKAYAVADKDNLPLGVTAVAMVAYKSATAGESLAIQLNDSPEKMNWADAKTNAEGLTAVSGGTWRLPSKDDWQNMFVGCAVSGDATVPDANNEMDPIAGFKAKIAATGITWKSSNYWSSTESSSPLAWLVRVKLDDGDAVAAFSQSPTFLQMAVLGCLAF